MNELDTFASLRPDVEALGAHDTATLRRDVFGASTEPQSPPQNQMTTGQPGPRQHPRWFLAAAAAVLTVVGAAVVWAATANRAGDATTVGPPVLSPTDANQPAWYQTVRSLLPPGFDYIAILPPPEPSDEGQLYVVAAQPSTGLVFEIAIDTRADSADVVIGDDGFTDRWGSYLDSIDASTLVTPDGRWVRARCGVTGMASHFARSAAEVAQANDVCDIAGGPTVIDRRAVAARFTDAAHRGDLDAVVAAVGDAESMTTIAPGVEYVGVPQRREFFDAIPEAADGLKIHTGIVYGVYPQAGDPDPQIHRIALGARSDQSLASYPEVETVDEIATATFVKDGVLYQAVTTGTSESDLAELDASIRHFAESNDRITPATAPTSPPTDTSPTPSASDQSVWYSTVSSLLPPGFDQIAIMPARQGLPDGELYVVAAQPSSGLVLDIAVDTRPQSTGVDIEDDWFTDQWGSYLDNIERSTLVTPDRRWVRVRCGVTVMDGTYGDSAAGVALANDVCDAAGGPTVADRRAIAARFADAADRGELAAVLEAASALPPAIENSEDLTDGSENVPGSHLVDDTGRRESIEMLSGATDRLTTNVGMLYGVVPGTGDPDPQFHRISLGARSDRSLTSYPEVETVDEIATVTFVRNGVLYQAVTTDTSGWNLEVLDALVRRFADNNPLATTATAPSTTLAPTDPTTPPTTQSTAGTERAATAPTVAPTPQPEAPEMTNPPEWFQNRLAVGDDVVHSAAVTLTEDGWYVAAQQGHSPGAIVTRLEQLATWGFENDLVLVHIGTDGTLTTEQIDAVLAPLADAELVVLYNVHGDLAWRGANNELLAQAAAARSNVKLIDWNTLAASCPGDCLYPDGIHLKPDGIAYFEQLATDAWTNR